MKYIMKTRMGKTKPNSYLPSPMAYVGEKCMDYDSMGDYSRFPKTKEKKNNIMKRMIQKILLWQSFVKPKKNRLR